MKKSLTYFFLFFSFISKAQTTAKIDTTKLLKELADQACACIDSVETFNRSKDSINANISSCIDEKISSYQITEKLANIDLSNPSGGKKEINVSLNLDKNSKEYKDIYYKFEHYLMDNCVVLKDKIASKDQLNDHSISSNKDAMDFYNLGIEEGKKENFKKAIEYYKKAVVFDPNFAFAYDNMGICYRRLEEYDLAIDSYEKSLKIDPNGKMPLQNIAVAYAYKKNYKKAVKAYEKLAGIDANDPEVFYGIGQMYALYLNDNEKALNNMCQAYRLYVEQKSPYRTDAEKIIQLIYANMKKEGKEDKFTEILKANNLNSN
ncbi:tetratricopeptide repeat protein [Flavobacterium sp. ANB]|jgi:tetratricopeptide (TPR) repeat protein|uniref:tetratricopeptide repeat protein n=1 Tax=unclassified Flavobacterium TaxID=196869 RepID=UPI0012B98FD5|nr:MULTISPECIES: tetratricopeptide repeat protein [unclassified Flavobacterium]MBF4518450.1 tetratricopeptide repeat protein [Flavobacterium sp. ANB]MTD70856.1 tetratricopeptide repeat protein [Flavobacterium sp. LC2016-13]